MKVNKLIWRLSIILLTCLAVWLVRPVTALAASFYLQPSKTTAKIGDTVTVSVVIDSGGVAINAGEGAVSYTDDVLEYQSLSTAGSIFSFWTSGPTGNANAVNFGGGLATPGYSGSGGQVLTINYKAKANGTATIGLSGSKILANDGAGTNVLTGSSGTAVVVGGGAPAPTATKLATRIKSTTHPEQDKWYSSKKVSLEWSAAGATGYSFVFDQAPATNPPATRSSLTKKEFEAQDGVWYFHAKATDGSQWGSVTHFKVQVDTTPPEEFKVAINYPDGNLKKAPKVNFSATDATSGIAKYEAVIDHGEPMAIKDGDSFTQRPGSHTIMVRAFDQAGNQRESQATFYLQGTPAPVVVKYTKRVGILDPPRFVLKAKATDTIIVFLNDKEITRFTAKDKEIVYQSEYNVALAADADQEITFEYLYDQLLLPGEHTFRFARLDIDGQESEPTPPMIVKVLLNTVKISNFILPTAAVLAFLVTAIALLVIIVIRLVIQLRRLARHPGWGSTYGWVKKVLGKTEKEVEAEIDETIPETSLEAKAVKALKKDLKGKVHRTFKKDSG